MQYNGWLTDDEPEIKVSEEGQVKQNEIDKELEALYTPQAVKALTVIRDMLVKRGVVNPNDTQMGVGLKQGKLDMILTLLDNAERVNNGG